MSKQTHKQTMKDRAKKRQEYLEKVTIANMAASVGCLLLVVCLLICLSTVIGVVAAIAEHFSDDPSPYLIDHVQVVIELTPLVLFFCGAAVGAWSLVRKMGKTEPIPYVPPVEEQLSDIDADEVLLRGSDKPTATADELLRAARLNVVTPTDEMLRSTEQRP